MGAYVDLTGHVELELRLPKLFRELRTTFQSLSICCCRAESVQRMDLPKRTKFTAAQIAHYMLHLHELLALPQYQNINHPTTASLTHLIAHSLSSSLTYMGVEVLPIPQGFGSRQLLA